MLYIVLLSARPVLGGNLLDYLYAVSSALGSRLGGQIADLWVQQRCSEDSGVEIGGAAEE